MVKLIKAVVALSTVVLVVGCSNNNSSPTAINDNENKSIASLDEIQIQDVSAVGLGNLWALSKVPAGSSGDYYLAKYNMQYGWWDILPHYGKMVSVTPFGRCYHVNSYNQIWFATTGGNGFVPNNTNIINITDIAAAVTNNYEYVYIVGTTSNQSQAFWRATLYGGTLISWTQMPVKTPSQISVDPWNYQTLVAIEAGSVYSSTNGGGSWTRESILNYLFPFSAAVSGNKIVAVVSNSQGKFVVKFNRGDSMLANVYFNPKINVAADNANGYQLYFIDSNYHLQQRAF